MDPMAVKSDYFCHQSGVIPYRVRKGNLEILLITSRRERRWIIPKGIIDVHAKLLGIYRHRKWGRTCTVKVYPMRVTRIYKVWDEADRDRAWVSLKKALKLVSNDGLRQVMKKLPETL
jgi:hypothetical protein